MLLLTATVMRRYIVIFEQDHEVLEVSADEMYAGDFHSWTLDTWELHDQPVSTNVLYQDEPFTAVILQV